MIVSTIIFSYFLIGFDSINQTHAEQFTIPDWVKDNAKWWSTGQIKDSDFVLGIQYMIKSGIIVVPETESSTHQSSDKIPNWIKNNAGWWADGRISNNDFVLGLQYMIRNGIIRISPDYSESKEEQIGHLSVSLEGKPIVNLGESQFVTVTVTDGKNIVKDASVLAKVTYAYGNPIKNFEGKSNTYGEYRFSWNIEGYTPGTYTIKIDASKNGYTAATGLFSFKVPKLVT